MLKSSYIIRIPEENIIFIPIQRCASTSLTRSFLNALGYGKPKPGSGINTKNISNNYDCFTNAVKEKFPNDFIWGFVRNPYDLVCSHAFGAKNPTRIIELKWIETIIKSGRIKNWRQHKIINPKIIDYLGHFENLSRDFNTLCELKNWNYKGVKEIHINNHRRKIENPSNWKQFYNDRKVIDLINEYLNEDFKQFGYKKI